MFYNAFPQLLQTKSVLFIKKPVSIDYLRFTGVNDVEP